MRFSDIKERHIYYVDFNPVDKCEFNGKHLSLVLKKNNDKNTVIVVPLTTSSNGVGVNKTNIGKISTLPDNLKNRDSFVVFNQVRTVNVIRFRPLINNQQVISSALDETLFGYIVAQCIDELSTNVSPEVNIRYYLEKYKMMTAKELIDTAYKIKRITKEEISGEESYLIELVSKINSLWDNRIRVSDYFNDAEKKNGIQEIFDKCLDSSILNENVIDQKIS